MIGQCTFHTLFAPAHIYAIKSRRAWSWCIDARRIYYFDYVYPSSFQYYSYMMKEIFYKQCRHVLQFTSHIKYFVVCILSCFLLSKVCILSSVCILFLNLISSFGFWAIKFVGWRSQIIFLIKPIRLKQSKVQHSDILITYKYYIKISNI